MENSKIWFNKEVESERKNTQGELSEKCIQIINLGSKASKLESRNKELLEHYGPAMARKLEEARNRGISGATLFGQRERNSLMAQVSEKKDRISKLVSQCQASLAAVENELKLSEEVKSLASKIRTLQDEVFKG